MCLDWPGDAGLAGWLGGYLRYACLPATVDVPRWRVQVDRGLRRAPRMRRVVAVRSHPLPDPPLRFQTSKAWEDPRLGSIHALHPFRPLRTLVVVRYDPVTLHPHRSQAAVAVHVVRYAAATRHACHGQDRHRLSQPRPWNGTERPACSGSSTEEFSSRAMHACPWPNRTTSPTPPPGHEGRDMRAEFTLNHVTSHRHCRRPSHVSVDVERR